MCDANFRGKDKIVVNHRNLSQLISLYRIATSNQVILTMIVDLKS